MKIFLCQKKVDAVNIGSMCHKGEGQYGPQIMTSSTRPPPSKSPNIFLPRSVFAGFVQWPPPKACPYSIEQMVL